MTVSNGVGDDRHGLAAGAEDQAFENQALDAGAEPDASLDRAIQARIGEQLRAMYDGLMEQPVPDRFHALLARLGDAGGLEG
jgi:hypothetical protein